MSQASGPASARYCAGRQAGHEQVAPLSAHAPRRRKASALDAQLRVIHALVIREMQVRFGQSRIGFVWLVIEPMMLAFGVSIIHWLSAHGLPNDIPIFLYYALGYSGFYMFRALLTRNAGAINSGRNLLFHHSIKLHDLTISRTVLEAAACMLVIMLIILGGILIVGEWPSNPGLFVLCLTLSALFGHGFGTFLAVLMVFYEPLERFVHPLTYLMMPFSAAFGSIDAYPDEAREVLLWNPLVHINEALRDAMWGARIVSYYDLSYLVVWVLLLNLLALAGLRAARPHLTLSQ
jgi:capsular polysaccharide transport system permease protein